VRAMELQSVVSKGMPLICMAGLVV